VGKGEGRERRIKKKGLSFPLFSQQFSPLPLIFRLNVYFSI
jgi:hypothetical protein